MAGKKSGIANNRSNSRINFDPGNSESDIYKLKIEYFPFGGGKGVGEKASRNLANMNKGLKSVGYLNPGFGSVPECSSDEILSKVNAVQSNILLVALGACKGQLWIQHNLKKLNANIITHLGATINFFAGSVKRAPEWMQKSGLEWLWRIIEEPLLYKRYIKDGMAVFYLLMKNLLNYYIVGNLNKKYADYDSNETVIVNSENNDGIITLSFGEVYNLKARESLRVVFASISQKKLDIQLDFQRTKYIDNSFLGLLLLVFKHQRRNSGNIHIINVGKNLDRIFRINLIDKTLAAMNFADWRLLKQ